MTDYHSNGNCIILEQACGCGECKGCAVAENHEADLKSKPQISIPDIKPAAIPKKETWENSFNLSELHDLDRWRG